MIPYERQEKILQLIKGHDLIRIEEIQAAIPSVSLSTLRRDLLELEQRGEVHRLSGGAVKAVLTENELSITTKAIRHTKEKNYIAKLAAGEVAAGDTVYLDSGSSCTILLNELLNLDIHIVTSNTDVVKYIGQFRAEITFLGGTYNPSLSSVSGPLTIDNINNFILDKAFIGANGVDVQHGVTTPSLAETAKKREVVKRSKKAYVLADSSKFKAVSAVKIFEVREIIVIADKNDTDLAKETIIIFE